MSALETLRRKAEQAAEALTQAQAKAQAEAEAIAARNDARRRTFWEGVRTGTIPAAQQAERDARAAFAEAVAAGGDVVGAYVSYVTAHELQQAIMRDACKALAVYVNDLTGQPNEPGDNRGRAVYPEGLHPASGKPAAFLELLEQAVAEAAEVRARTALADLRAPLLDALEPEPDTAP